MYPSPKEALNVEDPHKDSHRSETKDDKDSISTVPVESQKGIDNFEPIDVEGQNETGIWVHQPGSDVSKIWEPRKGRSRRLDTEIQREPNESISSGEIRYFNNDSSSTDDNPEEKSGKLSVRKGLRKLSSVFHRSPRDENRSGSLESAKSPQYANVRAVNAKEGGVKVILVDNVCSTASDKVSKEGKSSNDCSESESPEKGGGGNVKGMAKSFFRQAEKSARSIKHAFSRKGSKRFQIDSSGMNERDGAVESESSDDEPDAPAAACSSTTIVGVPVIHEATASTPRNNSFKNVNVLPMPTDSSDNVKDNDHLADKLIAVPLERIEDDEDDKPAINSDK